MILIIIIWIFIAIVVWIFLGVFIYFHFGIEKQIYAEYERLKHEKTTRGEALMNWIKMQIIMFGWPYMLYLYFKYKDK